MVFSIQLSLDHRSLVDLQINTESLLSSLMLLIQMSIA